MDHMETWYQCRICLDICAGCVSLFSENNNIAALIRFCAGVKITEDDRMPSHVCPECSQQALLAYEFISKCRQSDAELRTQQVVVDDDHPSSEPESTASHSRSPSYTQFSLNIEFDENLYAVETLDEAIEFVSSPAKQTLKEHDELEDIDYEAYYDETEELLIEDNGNEVAQPSSIAEQKLSTEAISGIQKDPVTQDEYFCCFNECTLQFTSHRGLQEHFQSQHSDERGEHPHDGAYRCANCDQTFPCEAELMLHERLLRLKQTLLDRQRYGRPTAYPIFFEAAEKVCCGCSERFPTMEALLEHSERDHSIRKAATDPTRPEQCQICYKLFRSEGHARVHQIAAYKPRVHRCPACPSAFITASQLAAHQTRHQPGHRYVCAECGTGLKTEQSLKMHTLLHREKREVCDTCGLRFHRRSNLKMHQRVHAGTFYAQCPYCSKRLKTQSTLKEHMKMHTKVTPYQCRYCPKRFRYLIDHKRHQMVHTGNYPFVCQHCDKQFARPALYHRHIERCVKAMSEQSG